MDATGNANSISTALSLVARDESLAFIGHSDKVLGIDIPTLYRAALTSLASRTDTRRDFGGVSAHLLGWAIAITQAHSFTRRGSWTCSTHTLGPSLSTSRDRGSG